MFKAHDRLIPGTQIQMNGDIYEMPPLTLGQWTRLKDAREKLARATDGPMTEEWIEANLALIQAALTRNYDGVDIESLRDMIDFGNLRDIGAALFSLNKLTAAAATANGATSPLAERPVLAS